MPISDRFSIPQQRHERTEKPASVERCISIEAFFQDELFLFSALLAHYVKY